MSLERENYWRRRASSFSRLYDDGGASSIRRVVSGFLDSRTRALMTRVDWDSQAILLDVGCGSGAHMRMLAPRCRCIWGLDASPEMLGLAAKALGSLTLRNWRLVVGDAESMPLPDRFFDGILAMGLLDYVVSPARVLSECHRVLQPAGSLLLSVPKRPSLFGFLRTRAGNLIKRLLFDLPPISNAVSRRELDRLLESSGFEGRDTVSVWTTMWMVKAVRKDRG